MRRSSESGPTRRYLLPIASALVALGLVSACSANDAQRSKANVHSRSAPSTTSEMPSNARACTLKIARLSINGHQETFRLTAQEPINLSIPKRAKEIIEYDEGFGSIDGYAEAYPDDSIKVTYSASPPEKDATAYIKERESDGVDHLISKCSTAIPYLETNSSTNQ